MAVVQDGGGGRISAVAVVIAVVIVVSVGAGVGAGDVCGDDGVVIFGKTAVACFGIGNSPFVCNMAVRLRS